MTDAADDLPPKDQETYLGDGLYAAFDGWTVWLRAPRETGDHKVALEPAVFRSLRQWIAAYPKLKRHMES